MAFAKLCKRGNIEPYSSKTFLAMKKNFQSSLGPVESARFCNQFLHLDDVKEMFTLLWNNSIAHKCFQVANDCSELKMDEISKSMREDGNRYYKKSYFQTALQNYNRSITYAPHPKLPLKGCCPYDCGLEGFESLGCGYANRSAVFLSIKDYKRCLIDIDLAFKYGYPKHQWHKLIERRERCIKEQKKYGVKDESIKSINAQNPPKLASVNDEVPAFSASLKVINSEERGRHVVTTREIPPGEVLAVDKGYCSFIRYDRTMYEVCSECLMRCNNQIIPCPECMSVFCSEDCRSKGLAGRHGKECEIIGYLLDLEINDEEICNALRTVIHTTFHELKKKLPVLRKEVKELSPEKYGFDPNGVFNSSDYRSVYHITALNSRKPNVKLLNYCIVAFLLTKVLRESKAFFLDETGKEFDPSDEDCIITGSSLLHHFAYNCVYFEVSDMKIYTQTNKTDNQGVGSSLFPSVCLIRHACNSNAAHYNIGPVRVVRSVRSIPKGSEVTLMYSEGYEHLTLPLRKQLLEARGIQCSCQACKDDWPVLAKLPNEIKMKCVKCSDLSVPLDSRPVCMTCNIQYAKINRLCEVPVLRKFWLTVDEFNKAQSKYAGVISKIGKGQELTVSDFKDICNFIIAMEKHVALPCPAFTGARMLMMKYFMLE
ncbi:SET and MYND domain-containing protein 4-like [Palaemon carinicauda]|uniref:SET and MYND domain-containing protein 4-like n=1 Tax=Palaemon carinicauda TaxID=392227 RepID=UPI0035B5C755